MGAKGLLGEEATQFFGSLSLVDHVIRTSQVILIDTASILLVFRRRVARVLFWTCFVLGLVSTLLNGKWVITFLGGPGGLLLLGVVLAYAHWLTRRQLLN